MDKPWTVRRVGGARWFVLPLWGGHIVPAMRWYRGAKTACGVPVPEDAEGFKTTEVVELGAWQVAWPPNICDRCGRRAAGSKFLSEARMAAIPEEFKGMEITKDLYGVIADFWGDYGDPREDIMRCMT